MGSPQYGARKGRRLIVRAPVDSATADIEVGDLLTLGTAGYVQQAAAGETLVGVAVTAVASPSADGGAYVEMDISEETIYEFPPDTGTVTEALRFAPCDVGGPKSINIDASLVDNVLIVDVDTDSNTVFCTFTFTHAGVV